MAWLLILDSILEASSRRVLGVSISVVRERRKDLGIGATALRPEEID